MNSNAVIQLIITAGSVFIAMFATYRYSVKEKNKSEKDFRDFIQKMQDKQMEYYSEKNGHLERISFAFTETIDKNTRALDKLSSRIKDKK